MQKIETPEVFFSLLKQPRTVYRYNSGSGRIYFTENEAKEVALYLSVTTFISRAMPTSPFLIDWIVQHGKREAERLRDERANYGTFLHILFADTLLSKSVNLDVVEAKCKIFIEQNNLSPDFINNVPEFKRDLLALVRFIIDFNVDPVAIEIVLASDKLRIAGAIDLLCYMDITETGFFGETYKSGDKKGQPKESKQTKRVLAIVDLKSGRKGFHESHAIQLSAYREIVRENFPELNVTHLFNLAPKEWRAEPSYTLTDQTDNFNIAKLEHMIAIAEVDDLNPNRKITVCEGQQSLTGGDFSFAKLYKTVTFGEHIRELKQKELVTEANLIND